MIFQHNNLRKCLFLNQMTNTPVDIPQACHINSHMTYHWMRLYQLQIFHQVTLPLDIFTFLCPRHNQNFHKSPQKDQTDPPVLSSILSYVPEASLLQLDSLKMLLQDAAYPADIPASNEYLLEYNMKLIKHITGLLHDHCMFPIAL